MPSYADKQSREEYLAMMRRVLEGVRELLRPDGMLFLHCDFRANPILRTIADEPVRMGEFFERNYLGSITRAEPPSGISAASTT